MEKHISDYIELPGIIFRSHIIDADGLPFNDMPVKFMFLVQDIQIIREEPDNQNRLTRSAIGNKEGNFYTVLYDYNKLKHYIERIKENQIKQHLLIQKQ